MRSILLTQHAQWRCKEDIGHIEYGKNGVILASLEIEVLLEIIGLCVSKVPFIKGIEEVHDGQDGEESKVELAAQGTFGMVVNHSNCRRVFRNRKGIVGRRWRFEIFGVAGKLAIIMLFHSGLCALRMVHGSQCDANESEDASRRKTFTYVRDLGSQGDIA